MRQSAPRAAVLLYSLALLQSISAQAAEPAKQRQDKAAARLEQELTRHPNDPALQYNHGTLLYHDEHYEQAAESLRKALSASRAALQGRAAYNLGNTYYRLGQAKEAAKSADTLALYKQALDGYRLAIKQDPHDSDARYNYELVQKRMTALEAQQAKTQETKAQQGQAEQDEASAAQQQERGASQQAEEQHAEAQETQAAQSAQEQQAASETSAQQQEEQPQTEPQRDASQAAERTEEQGEDRKAAKASASKQEASDEKELSKQQALWILDSVKREEQGALKKDGHASEVPVERDW